MFRILGTTVVVCTYFVASLFLFAAVTPAQAAEKTLHEGFFPFGILHSISDNSNTDSNWQIALQRQASDWRKQYVNTVCMYGMGGMPPGNFAEVLDILGPKDIKTWGFLYMPTAYLPSHPEVPKNCAKFLDEHKNDDRILAYTIKDEPKQEHRKVYGESVELFRKHDPNHPVISIFFRNDSVVPYLDVLDTICIDTYPIRCRTRDPWWVDYHAQDLRKIAKNKPYWYCLQAHNHFGKDYVDRHAKKMFQDTDIPTVGEFRLMSWLAVAGGADGVIWFLYKWPSPWETSNRMFGEGLVSMIESPGPLWGEIKRLGLTLAPIGRLLVGSKVLQIDDIEVVNGKKFRLPPHDFVANAKQRPDRPVITLHFRKQPESNETFVFAINNDVTKSQKCKLVIPVGKYPVAYDLLTLKKVQRSAVGETEFTLQPGAANVILLADEKISVAAMNSIRRYRIKMRCGELSERFGDMVRAGVAPKKSSVNELIKSALLLSEENKYDQAQSRVETADSEIEKILSSNPEYLKCLNLLAEIASTWGKADQILNKRALAIKYDEAPNLQPYVILLLDRCKNYLEIRDQINGYTPSSMSMDDYAVKLEKIKKQLENIYSQLKVAAKAVPEDKVDLYAEKYQIK